MTQMTDDPNRFICDVLRSSANQIPVVPVLVAFTGGTPRVAHSPHLVLPEFFSELIHF
jgi:hypothetical protein